MFPMTELVYQLWFMRGEARCRLKARFVMSIATSDAIQTNEYLPMHMQNMCCSYAFYYLANSDIYVCIHAIWASAQSLGLQFLDVLSFLFFGPMQPMQRAFFV
jgi:hypothetical protein